MHLALLLASIMESWRKPVPSFGQLTEAEQEVATLLSWGCSNKEIALHLGKSVRTVKSQCTSIYRKLGVRGRSRLHVLLRSEAGAPRRISASPGQDRAPEQVVAPE